MCEFKKGDKIICVNTDNHEELIKDKIYEVEKSNGDFVYLEGCKYGYFTFLFRKECKYCSNTERIAIINRKGILGLTIWSKNNLTVYGKDEKGWDISEDRKINYCPICGRNLVEKYKYLKRE